MFAEKAAPPTPHTTVLRSIDNLSAKSQEVEYGEEINETSNK